jgi:ABC-2 type transport system permease protein
MPAAIASILEYLSIEYHFSNIERGVIDTRDIIYYVSMIIVALSLGTIMVQKRRW